ncbi:MAG: diphosphomevalonate decarboxylase [Myxococcales bacterium]|nr:diphosphomevalonate decarboxylase [Myxococcales bacterium]
MSRGFCRARANIALAKYWGKCDAALNLPAVPSVSLTLDALVTETEVQIDPSLEEDQVWLNGVPQEGAGRAKVSALLASVRGRPEARRGFARVTTQNHFPSASGLASSASGFAALTGAAARAYEVPLSLEAMSSIARRGSASAARSVFEGWCALPAGTPGDDWLPARPLYGVDHWEVCMVLALVTHAPKAIASRDGMRETARTSPYWGAWLGCAPGYVKAVTEGVAARDLEATGAAMEASTAAMHASAWAAVPAVRYIKGVTLELLDAVQSLRAAGVGAWATMDAGPHVKVLCLAHDSARVSTALAAVPGVVEVRVARPGRGLEFA